MTTPVMAPRYSSAPVMMPPVSGGFTASAAPMQMVVRGAGAPTVNIPYHMLGNVGDQLSPEECRAFGVPQGSTWLWSDYAGGRGGERGGYVSDFAGARGGDYDVRYATTQDARGDYGNDPSTQV